MIRLTHCSLPVLLLLTISLTISPFLVRADGFGPAPTSEPPAVNFPTLESSSIPSVDTIPMPDVNVKDKLDEAAAVASSLPDPTDASLAVTEGNAELSATVSEEAATETASTTISVPSPFPATFSPFFTNEADACQSCCNGGSCSYSTIDAQSSASASASPSSASASATPRLHFVQCCGVLRNQPKCCPVNRGMTGTSQMCGVDENGYICKERKENNTLVS